jgi:hypothetical protein
MTKFVQDLWILLKTGAVIFHYSSSSHENKQDPNIMGAILSAVDTYSEQLSEGGVSSFQFVNKRLTFLKTHNMMFVVSTQTKTKPKKIQQFLNDTSDDFFNLYTVDALENWEGDFDFFDEFNKELKTKFKL